MFERWPTGAILFLMLTAALLPLGLVLGWAAQENTRSAESAYRLRSDEQARAASFAIDSLIARHAAALRIAGNAALSSHPADSCRTIDRTLAIVPNRPPVFRVRGADGTELCTKGDIPPEMPELLVPPGQIRAWVSRDGQLRYRIGLVGGTVTGTLTPDQLRQAVEAASGEVYELSITDGTTDLSIIDDPASHIGDPGVRSQVNRIAAGQLQVRTVSQIGRFSQLDQFQMFLPLIMWLAAALLSWLLVRRLLLQPLKRLQLAISEYQPGEETLELPNNLGAASEIRDLCTSFERAVDRIEGAEREALEALDGQRRLVREVHHRVKNNLQVVASLLSIHGRSATEPEAQAAYAAIGRRVDALSVVHRNHYAELEESRGIALRPLVTELTTGLRSSAPPDAQRTMIELDLDSPSTTQDVAVAAAFLVTEIVEFAMLNRPGDKIEISLRRIDELTAVLAISASVLVPDSKQSELAKEQFERIVEGLARQLRSPLERIVGRYAVSLPIFPES